MDPVRKVGSRRKVDVATEALPSEHESTLDQLGKPSVPLSRSTSERIVEGEELLARKSPSASANKGRRVPTGTHRPNNIVNVPNLLSIARIFMVPLFLWLVLGPQLDGLACVVLVLSAATDFLDGKIARSTGQVTKVGSVIDPIADRISILAVVFALALREIVPWWLALALLLRDVFLLALVPLLRTRGLNVLPVHFVGKMATAVLLCAFPLLLLGDGTGPVANLSRVFGWALGIWGMALYLWSGFLYALHVRAHLRDAPRSRR